MLITVKFKIQKSIFFGHNEVPDSRTLAIFFIIVSDEKRNMFLDKKKVENVLYQRDLKPKIGDKIRIVPQKVYDGETFDGIYYNHTIGRFISDSFKLARVSAADMSPPWNTPETPEELFERMSKAISARDGLIGMILKPGVDVFATPVKVDFNKKIISEIETSVPSDPEHYLNISTMLLEKEIVSHQKT